MGLRCVAFICLAAAFLGFSGVADSQEAAFPDGYLDISTYAMEVERFIAVEERAPLGEAEMLVEGYLFFVPPERAVTWNRDGDNFELAFSREDGEEAGTRRLTIPGTEAFESEQQFIARTTYEAAPTFKRLQSVTWEQVEDGSVTMHPWRTLRAYCDDDAEWKQLCWARSLATTLARCVVAYKQQHGEYPYLKELLEFAGERNEAAWVSPKTGYRMQLQPYQSTSDPYYLHDSESWEFTVPLFGAGNKEDALSFFWPGKHFVPGEYMRVGYGPGEEGLGALMVY